MSRSPAIALVLLLAGCGDNTEPTPGCDGPCVTTLEIPNVIAASDDRLYFLTYNAIQPPNSVMATSRTDVSARNAVSTGQQIAVDGTTLVVYAFERMVGTSWVPKVFACANETCESRVMLFQGGGAGNHQLLGARDGIAYWFELEPQVGMTVWSCAETGCTAPTQVASGLPPVERSGVFPFGAIDGENLYVAYPELGVYVIPRTGGMAVRIAEQQGVRGLSVGTQGILWSTQTAIRACPRAATACTPSTFATGNAVSGLVVDHDDVYWIDGGKLYTSTQATTDPMAPIATCEAFVHRDYPDVQSILPPMVVTADAIYCRDGDARVLEVTR